MLQIGISDKAILSDIFRFQLGISDGKFIPFQFRRNQLSIGNSYFSVPNPGARFDTMLLYTRLFTRFDTKLSTRFARFNWGFLRASRALIGAFYALRAL